MKLNQPQTQPTCQAGAPAHPQMPVRSGLVAGLNADCTLGLSYWRRELNRQREIADAYNCS